MSEFKGTKGKLEPKYVSGVCIGIGTIREFSQITANSILPDTDDDYNKERIEIESNMLLYSKSPELLEMVKLLVKKMEENDLGSFSEIRIAKELIKKATEL